MAERALELSRGRGPALLTTLLLIPFLGALFSQHLMVGNRNCDGPLFFYFVFGFAADCWTEGHIPLWNPYVKLGFPFLGEGQASVFYPLTALFIPFDTGKALTLYLASHFVMSGLFFYGFLRRCLVSRTATILATLSLCYSSVLLGRLHAGHVSVLTTLTWGFGIMYLWESYARTKNLKWLLLFTPAYFMLVVTGYPMVTLIFSLFLLGFALLRGLYDHWGSRTGFFLEHGKEMSLMGLFTALGIGISTISLLPALEYAKISYRSEISYEIASTYSFAPENLLTLLCPWFFGESMKIQEGSAPFFGRQFLWEAWFYLGIVTLLAALVGWSKSPKRMRYPLTLCLGLAFLMGLGKHTPFHRFLVETIPPFGLFRGSNRYMFVVAFCLFVFAAYGYDHWLWAAREKKLDKISRRLGVGFALVVLGLTAALGFYYGGDAGQPGSHWAQLIQWIAAQGEGQTDPPQLESGAYLWTTWVNARADLIRTSLLAVVAVSLLFLAPRLGDRRKLGGLLFALLFLDQGLFFHRYFYTFDERSITEFVAAVPKEELKTDGLPVRVVEFSVLQNMAMTEKFSTVGGYTGNAVARYNTFLNRSQGLGPEKARTTEGFLQVMSPQLYLTGLQYLLLTPTEVPPSLASRVVTQNQLFALVSADNQFPRLFLASQVQTAESPAEALEAVLARPGSVVQAPVVENWEAELPTQPLAPEETVKTTLFEVNRIKLETQTDQARLLVITEMFTPGWRATVNGVDTPIYPTNYLFRGVVVPPGEAEVELVYDPPAFRWGKWVTALFLILWLVVGITIRRTV